MSHRTLIGGLLLASLSPSCETPASSTEERSTQVQPAHVNLPTFELAEPAPPAAPALDVEPYRAHVEALIRGALECKSHAILKTLCEAAPHRLSGSDDAAKAVEWGLGMMRKLGFENVRGEPVLVPHWVRGQVAVLGPADPGEHFELTLRVLALGGSVGTPAGGLVGRVIEVQSFEELHARADEARGKFVFFNRPMERAQHDCFEAYGGAVNQRGQGASEAAKVGAIGALVRSMTMRDDDAPHTGSMGYAEGVERVPAVALGSRSATYLSGHLEQDPEVELRLELDCQTLEDVPSFNVVGEIVGRERPDEIVLLGAHLDAWDVGQGAHDDGAGCAHVLEAARLIREAGVVPRRTIRVVLFMNEENGVRGGKAYFEAHSGDKHVLALESDAGGFTPRGFSTDANPEALATLRAIATLLGTASAANVIEGWGGVDISPLAKTGVPLVGFRPDDERYFDFHHSENDTLDAVHPRELALGAGAIAGLAWVAAELPDALPANEPKPAR